MTNYPNIFIITGAFLVINFAIDFLPCILAAIISYKIYPDNIKLIGTLFSCVVIIVTYYNKFIHIDCLIVVYLTYLYGPVLFSSRVNEGIMYILTQIQSNKKNIIDSINDLTDIVNISTRCPPDAIIENDTIIISFVYRGKIYSERLFYNKRDARSDRSFYGIKDHAEIPLTSYGNEVNLSYHPGIKHILTPNQIGFDKVVIKEFGSEIKTCRGNDLIEV